MALWNAQGSVSFDGGCALRPHMELDELLAALPERPPIDDVPDPIVTLPAQTFEGGALAPVCFFHGTRLHAVELTVERVGQKRGTAEQQRALLFACVGASDPAPDTRRPVVLRCGFGTAAISTDPRSGTALMRLTYR